MVIHWAMQNGTRAESQTATMTRRVTTMKMVMEMKLKGVTQTTVIQKRRQSNREDRRTICSTKLLSEEHRHQTPRQQHELSQKQMRELAKPIYEAETR